MRTITKQSMEKINEYFQEKLQEKKLELLFTVPTDIYGIPERITIEEIKQYVNLGEHFGGEDVHVFEQTFDFQMPDNVVFRETFCSFYTALFVKFVAID